MRSIDAIDRVVCLVIYCYVLVRDRLKPIELVYRCSREEHHFFLPIHVVHLIKYIFEMGADVPRPQLDPPIELGPIAAIQASSSARGTDTPGTSRTEDDLIVAPANASALPPVDSGAAYVFLAAAVVIE
jgi:hypothetical protein